MKQTAYFIQMLASFLAVFAMASRGWSDPNGILSRPDIVIEDFERASYGNWTVTGQAFGDTPAHGSLQSQMAVDGFLGGGFASSYHQGDGSIGKLTSQSYKVERKYIKFLIGGGGFAGKTCINLINDGKVVRTATGSNTRPGGSEHLDWQAWEVSELEGKSVVLEIIDQATGGWGHVSIDQIVQTDRKMTGLIRNNVALPIRVEKRYLNLPVKNGAVKRVLRLTVNGKTEREFEIELANAEPDWWTFMDVTAFKGQSVILHANKLKRRCSRRVLCRARFLTAPTFRVLPLMQRA